MAYHKKIFFTISMLCSCRLFSQRPPTALWLSTQLPVEINNNWTVQNDASYRTLGSSIAPSQYLYRTGLRYTANNKWTIATGIAFFFTRTTFSKQQDEFGKEFRFWEELNYKMAIQNNLQSILRFRTEQRSYKATSKTAAYHAFRYRLRTQFQQTLSPSIAVQLSEEYMEQYAHHNLSFDQNRVATNLVYSFNNKAKLIAGYIWELRPQHVSQHILSFNFQKTISIHAKQ